MIHIYQTGKNENRAAGAALTIPPPCLLPHKNRGSANLADPSAPWTAACLFFFVGLRPPR